MMKIVQINSTSGVGSIGKICEAVSKTLTQKGIENYIFYTQGVSNNSQSIKYASDFDIKKQALKSRIFGNNGFNSSSITKHLIEQLVAIKPDIVHLHNLHSHNCNLEMLMSYLRNNNIKIFWTFHDCWAFTGYCMYFDIVSCEKWKNICHKCTQYKKYSWICDRSEYLFSKKKSIFTGLNLTIITPSVWLSDLVQQSFLSDYHTKIINNGIDLSVFKPRISDFRSKYNCENKFIVLGVAMGWEYRKGLEYFIRLANDLDDKCKIVLVGTNKKIENNLPENIISINRTENQEQLAEIYSSADLFVDPTLEDNYPTTHLESIACGTPVLTFNTGGSAEMINERCGMVVEKGNYQSLLESIVFCEKKYPFIREACANEAVAFSQEIAFQKYVDLYSVL